MGSEHTKIGALVDMLMSKVGEVADAGDWTESDGWVGKWTIRGDHREIVKAYSIKEGKFENLPTGSSQVFTGEVEMSEDTFLDLMDGALHGKGEEVFVEKYAKRAIKYKGSQWIVDSERFRKVLKRLSIVPFKGKQ
ncbi:hypothetical protein LCGC14_0918520 [marine sediment metagenome]|uniref:SCP2 domain-containing protein n=1 Tax=marine sediment metagenome TaxID=412755 RepID=A0A0F9NW95_9ZZZZ